MALTKGPDGQIYAAGQFEWSGMELVNRIARWEANSWKPLEFGLGGYSARALAVDADGAIMVVGDFSRAGDEAASYVARWIPDYHGDNEPLPTPTFEVSIYPNPFLVEANVEISLQETQVVRIVAYDVLGRDVAVLQDGVLEAGDRHSIRFLGESLPAGTY